MGLGVGSNTRVQVDLWAVINASSKGFMVVCRADRYIRGYRGPSNFPGFREIKGILNRVRFSQIDGMHHSEIIHKRIYYY